MPILRANPFSHSPHCYMLSMSSWFSCSPSTLGTIYNLRLTCQRRVGMWEETRGHSLGYQKNVQTLCQQHPRSGLICSTAEALKVECCCIFGALRKIDHSALNPLYHSIRLQLIQILTPITCLRCPTYNTTYYCNSNRSLHFKLSNSFVESGGARFPLPCSTSMTK